MIKKSREFDIHVFKTHVSMGLLVGSHTPPMADNKDIIAREIQNTIGFRKKKFLVHGCDNLNRLSLPIIQGGSEIKTLRTNVFFHDVMDIWNIDKEAELQRLQRQEKLHVAKIAELSRKIWTIENEDRFSKRQLLEAKDQKKLRDLSYQRRQGEE